MTKGEQSDQLRFTEEQNTEQQLLKSAPPKRNSSWNRASSFIVTPDVSDCDSATSENIVLMSQYSQYQQQRNWLERTFSPVDSGSLRGAIFNLMQASVGCGCLSLPYVYRSNGLLVGLFITIFCGLLSLFSMRLLVLASVQTKTNRYSALMRACFGKSASKGLQVLMVVFTLGALVSYQILISTMIMEIIDSFVNEIGLSRQTLRVILILSTMVVIFPLSLKRNLSSLNYVSLVSLVAIFYILVVIVVETPYYITTYWPKQSLSVSNILYFKFNLNLLIVFAVNLVSFTCCQIVFEIRSELNNNTLRRTFKVFNRSVGLEIVLYCLMGGLAYLSSLNNTPNVVLTRANYNGSIDTDYFMFMASVFMIFIMLCSIPTLVNPGRATLSSLVFRKEFNNSYTHFAFTLVFLGVPSLVAIFLPEIITAMSFLGGTCSILICVTFPVMCYVKSNKQKITSPKNLALIISTTILTILSYLAAILSLLSGLNLYQLPEV